MKIEVLIFINIHFLLALAIIFYHIGCYIEYKLGIEDTGRVVPVHGVWLVLYLLIHVYYKTIVVVYGV